jgi:hypothetical protein
MVRARPMNPQGSFRMPNSIVQGLVTATPAGLNRLTSFQMVTLFGLMSYVSPKSPEKEVRLKVRDILEIVRVGKNVNLAVERNWTTQAGVERRKRYQAVRYSPRHLEQVHEAQLALHNQSVAIQYFDRASGRKIKDQDVHILDSFGYCYQVDGRQLDVDDLPPDRDRVNIGTDDRPLWRVRRRTPGGDSYDRPSAITFRINGDLAREILGGKGTIRFTLFAHRVFDLFREFMRNPTAIRLLVLMLRQTQPEFTRCLTPMLDDLGFDVSHLNRAVEQLEEMLGRLHDAEIVAAFSIDRDTDRITVEVKRTWFREPGQN